MLYSETHIQIQILFLQVKGFGTFTASGKNYRVAKKKVAAIALKEIHNQQAAISQLPQLPNPPSSF